MENAPDGKIVKQMCQLQKLLGKEELAELNEIVTMYLDYATRQARRHIPMTMEDWKTKLDAFLRFNDADVLQDKGKVTAAIAKEFAESEFEKYRVIQDSLYESDFDKLMNDMERMMLSISTSKFLVEETSSGDYNFHRWTCKLSDDYF